VNCEEEDTSRVWRIAGAHDSCLPVELIAQSAVIRRKHGRRNMLVVRISTI
jgi:hypothetical protein